MCTSAADISLKGRIYAMNYSKIWDDVSRRMRKSHLESNFAAYKSDEYLRIIRKWCGSLAGKKVLKTDLFEECYEADQFSDKLGCRNIYGLDVSKCMAANAKRKNGAMMLVAADIRRIPFRDRTFDIIISNSTLDHLKLKDVRPAVKELRRVLKDDGTLVLTIDNKYNPVYSAGLWAGNRLNIFYFPQERCYTSGEIGEIVGSENMEIVDEDAIFNIVPPMDMLMAIVERHNKKLSSGISKMIVRLSKRVKSKPLRYITGRQLAFKIKKVL